MFNCLVVLFVLGSLAVETNLPYINAAPADTFSRSLPDTATGLYVVAMKRLQIQLLPDIFNAMILVSAFSNVNGFAYCASRSLLGLALEGKALRFLTRHTKNGLPVYYIFVVLLMSLLQVNNSTAVVLEWYFNSASLVP